MPTFRDSRLVRLAAKDMFELVADFESYPEFVPFCLDARIRRRTTDLSGLETWITDMEMGYGAVRTRFATRDRLDREKGEIAVVNLSGPFRHFDALWTFHDLPQGGSRIAFTSRYQFSKPAFEVLLAPIFDRVVTSLAKAFVTRAHEKTTAFVPRPPGPPKAP